MLSQNIFKSIFLLSICLVLMASCKKYLDKKYDKRQAEISTLEDLQALLDNREIMNFSYTPLLEILGDEYLLPSSVLGTADVNERNNYLWERDATNLGTWSYPYQIVYYSNVILKELPKLRTSSTNDSLFNNIKGSALFFRALTFYYLSQMYCKPYAASAETDLGIAVRLSPDINVRSERANVKAVYDQIIKDLNEAISLLPETALGTTKTRPNRAAAFGVLSRTYLSMKEYANAGRYADSVIKRSGVLMNFNTLNTSSSRPIGRTNSENIFFAYPSYFNTIPTSTTPIDTTLIASYSNDDLRKSIFFTKSGNDYYFKGSYSGILAYVPFYGITTSEMYLIRSEASARSGLKDSAMADLNRLLITRWKTGTFVNLTAVDANDAKNKILAERRKELVCRGVRWTDLRRLNQEGANITLKRTVGSIEYLLPPNDLRWVLLIPTEVINQTGMLQNPR